MAAIHQQTLLDEAHNNQLARLSRSSKPGIPAWRRGLGSGARRLSSAFAFAARSLDPTAETEHSARRATERSVGRVLAC
jgi:hypothetical protein